MPTDTLSLVLPHQAWLFNITDFYHCDLMPPQISVRVTEWGPAKMLPIGPALAKAGPDGSIIERHPCRIQTNHSRAQPIEN